MSIIDTNIIDSMWIDEDNDLWLAIYDDLSWYDPCDSDSGVCHLMSLMRKLVLYKDFTVEKGYEKTFPSDKYPVENFYIAYYAKEEIPIVVERAIGEYEAEDEYFNIVYNAYDLGIEEGSNAVEDVCAVEGVENLNKQERLTYNRGWYASLYEDETYRAFPKLTRAAFHFEVRCREWQAYVKDYKRKPRKPKEEGSFIKRIIKKISGKKS